MAYRVLQRLCVLCLLALCLCAANLVRRNVASDSVGEGIHTAYTDTADLLLKRNFVSDDAQPYEFYHSDLEDNGNKEEKENVGAYLKCVKVKFWKSSPFDNSPCSTGDLTNFQKWKECAHLEGSNASCYCKLRYATCCGNWTTIPSFNRTILYLNFSGNALPEVNDLTLENVTQLKWLILDRNNISTVTSDAFQKTKSLECLVLTHNNKTGAGLNPVNFTSAVNQLPNLKLLSVNFTRFSPAQDGLDGMTYIMRHLNSTTIEKLSVSGGNKNELVLSDLAQLSQLKALSVASHSILNINSCREDSFTRDDKNVYESSRGDSGQDDAYRTTNSSARNLPSMCSNFSLPNLQLLDLAYNLLVQFPDLCHHNAENPSERTVVLPNLTEMSLALNAIVEPRSKQMTCLPNLKSLALTGNPLRTIEPRAFQNLPKLHTLDLRFTNVMFIREEAFNHSSLRRVNVQSSTWFFDVQHASKFSADLFVGSKLNWLDISYNVFRFVSPDRLEQLLKPLKTVTHLYMSEIGLFNVPEIITSTFLNLRHFKFDGNLVSYIAPNTFDNLTRLTYLNFADNLLTGANMELLDNLRKNKGQMHTMVRVNLAWNPFSCTCDLLEFHKLLTKNKGYKAPIRKTDAPLQVIGSQFRCYSPSQLYNQSLVEIKMTTQMCLLSVQQAVIINCACVIVILLIVVYSILYRYRWQVRYWMYTLHVRWNKRQTDQACRRTRFNAFVSYCPKDSNFVLTKVLPALETGYRLPLCIHERDFVPGRYISQNIVERMEESSRILLILSNAFLQDDWCRFELFVAQRYGLIYRQIPVTVLLLEPLNVQLMDPHVIMMLQSQPSLEWPGQDGEVRERDMFWQRLGESLRSANGRPLPPMSPRIRRLLVAEDGQ